MGTDRAPARAGSRRSDHTGTLLLYSGKQAPRGECAMQPATGRRCFHMDSKMKFLRQDPIKDCVCKSGAFK